MKTVVSASRRTDMPACHLDRLRVFIGQGFAEVSNPYSGRLSRVDLDPERVHTIVLWSKDFSPFLNSGNFFGSYRLYFLFTINDMPVLEPYIPPLARRIEQARELASRFGPDCIGWRFDPVVFGTDGPFAKMESFYQIGDAVHSFGVRRAIFSFLDIYGKVRARNERFSLGIADPPEEVKREYAERLACAAGEIGLSLESCSETALHVEGIVPGACIDGHILSRLANEPASTARDSGQRTACRCTESRDIGSYADMPCPHGCLYCYANPVVKMPGGCA